MADDTTLAHGFSHGNANTTRRKGRRPTQFLFVKRQESYGGASSAKRLNHQALDDARQSFSGKYRSFLAQRSLSIAQREREPHVRNSVKKRLVRWHAFIAFSIDVAFTIWTSPTAPHSLTTIFRFANSWQRSITTGARFRRLQQAPDQCCQSPSDATCDCTNHSR